MAYANAEQLENSRHCTNSYRCDNQRALELIDTGVFKAKTKHRCQIPHVHSEQRATNCRVLPLLNTYPSPGRFMECGICYGIGVC